MSLNGTILFLDFDKTLTDIHTGGFPHVHKSYWHNFINKQMIINLLIQLKSIGCKIYLITRADKIKIKYYIDNHFDNIFDDIEGNSDKIMGILERDEIEWANWKVKSMLKILTDLNHTNMSTVYFFDDTDLNIKQSLSKIPNSHVVKHGSMHLFDLLCKNVLPTTELIYNVPIYDVKRIYPTKEKLTYVLRKTSNKSTEKIVNTNNNFCILNVFTAVYSNNCKELFGVIFDENKQKRFVRFNTIDFTIDEFTLQIERIRYLNQFLEKINFSRFNLIDCTEHMYEGISYVKITDFI